MNDTNPLHVPKDEPLLEKIKELIAFAGSDPQTFDSDLIGQIIYTSLKMGKDGSDTGQIKLMTRAFKEMRYAYSVFNQYPDHQRISIFGSARTPETHPDYKAAVAFSHAMSAKGWACITGAAEGIMRAGLEGVKNGDSFGLSIRLPFETTANSLMAGDPKLITFRYFFTRKLMFLSHSDAIAAFPGGVGTQDELFEVLTLMQTGKANLLPLVLFEGEGGEYWDGWKHYIDTNLLANGWISQEDYNLFYQAKGVDDGVAHILQFYRRYHSSRYVNDTLVIRLKTAISQEDIEVLNQEFPDLLQSGKIYATAPLPDESDHLALPRIAFEHNHRHFGRLRLMLDRINAF